VRVVRPGERIPVMADIAEEEEIRREKVVVEVVEIHRFARWKGSPELLIAYKIHHRNQTTPVAHFWMEEGGNLREHLERVVRIYLETVLRLTPLGVEAETA